METVELRLYSHYDTEARAYTPYGEYIEEEVDIRGWVYSEGDTVRVGEHLYTISEIDDEIQADYERGNYISAMAQRQGA